MGLNRKQFLKKAWDTGILLFGSSALFELFAGEVPLKKKQKDPDNQIQWSMLIDIQKCLNAGDCTECITACHSIHNVPSIAEKKREIKWIWKEKYKHAFTGDVYEHIPDNYQKGDMIVMCNHCDNPPCVRVCPTNSTWRRKDGIVMMDMHRCIGCRYCMAACPYGSRSFNWSDPKKFIQEKTLNADYPARAKGIVEKCSFCNERVDRGILPACVVACKYKALSFGNITDPASDVRKLLKKRFAIRRKPSLGTGPQVYYLI